MIPAILSLIAAIGCYAITQLQMHGQLKVTDSEKPFSFYGQKSYLRKYKELNREKGEAFKFSTTLLVWTTDGYHCFQSLFFTFLSLSFAFLLGWWWGLGIFFGIRIVHFLARKLFSK